MVVECVVVVSNCCYRSQDEESILCGSCISVSWGNRACMPINGESGILLKDAKAVLVGDRCLCSVVSGV